MRKSHLLLFSIIQDFASGYWLEHTAPQHSSKRYQKGSVFLHYNHENGVAEKANDLPGHTSFRAKLDSILLDSSSSVAVSKYFLSQNRKLDWTPQQDLWLHLWLVVVFLKSCAAAKYLFCKLDPVLTIVVAFLSKPCGGVFHKGKSPCVM